MKKEVFKKFIQSWRILDVIFVLMAVVLGIYLKWEWNDIVIFTIFTGMIVRPFPSQYSAAVAMFFLVLTPIFLTFLGKENIAERLAVNAFYFLVMTVLMGMYELKKDESLLVQETRKEPEKNLPVSSVRMRRV